jgi:hypothetical protein
MARPASRLLAGTLCVLAAALVAGCPHDGWDGGGRVYHGGRTSFRTGPLGGRWERLTVEGPLVAFRDPASGGTVDVYARCEKDGDDVPLSALTGHLLIGFTERTVKEEKVVAMDGREALHTVVEAKLDGVPVALSLYVMKKDGCVWDLVYVTRPDRFEAGVPDFEAFVQGFGTVGG